MSREARQEAKRLRRQRRLAAREPGSARHLRALRRHYRLGGDRARGEGRKRVKEEIELARACEAKRLLDYGNALAAGAERLDKLVAATRPQEG